METSAAGGQSPAEQVQKARLTQYNRYRKAAGWALATELITPRTHDAKIGLNTSHLEETPAESTSNPLVSLNLCANTGSLKR